MRILNLSLRIIALILSVGGFYFFTYPLYHYNSFNAGNLFGLLISAVLLSYGIFQKYIAAFRGKLFYNIVLIVFIIGVVIVSVISGLMISAANKKTTGPATVIVLGCKVRDGRPSQMLQARIDAAYDYLVENPGSVAILSGGKGSDEAISEAECMYNELTRKGIDTSRLYIEDRSTNTAENFRYSKEILEANNLPKKVAVATSEYHEYRAQLIAKAEGLKCSAVSAHTVFNYLPTYFMREILGVMFELVFR